MNRRAFSKKSAGVLATAGAALGVKASADTVEPGPEVCKLRHTKDDGPPCVRVKVLSITQVEDVELNNHWNSAKRWVCEYEATGVDGGTTIRTASALHLGSGKAPKSFSFDLS